MRSRRQKEDQSPVPTEEAGGIFPAPSTEKSAPYDSKRAGLAPGPWNPLALVIPLSSKSYWLVEAFEEGLKRGTASVSVRGQMVDIPVYNRAKALLEQKQAIDELEQRKTRAVGRIG